jgi:hypothetical protein
MHVPAPKVLNKIMVEQRGMRFKGRMQKEDYEFESARHLRLGITKDKATSTNDYGRLQASFVPSHLLLALFDDKAIQERSVVEC